MRTRGRESNMAITHNETQIIQEAIKQLQEMRKDLQNLERNETKQTVINHRTRFVVEYMNQIRADINLPTYPTFPKREE